ncbi:MAG: hypothetical protein IKI93_16625, partial [Clostridia bacterium]|nr:hypothetical protein [Clostridia bacterium]
FTGKKVYTATDYHEKQLQRALLQWRKPENRRKIYEAMNYCSEEGQADLRELLGIPRNAAPKKEEKQPKPQLNGKSGAKSQHPGKSQPKSGSYPAKNSGKPYGKNNHGGGHNGGNKSFSSRKPKTNRNKT